MIGKLSGPLSVNHVLFRRLRKLSKAIKSFISFTTWNQKVIDNKNYSINEGSSPINTAWYGSRYLDFQGNQSIEILPILPTQLKSISFAFMGNNVKLFGMKASWATFLSLDVNTFQLRLSGGVALFNYRMTLDKYTVITININDNNTADLYIHGMFYETIAFTGTIEEYGVVETICQANTAMADCAMDYVVLGNDTLTTQQIELQNSNPNEFYDSCVNPNGDLYSNTLFATDFNGSDGYIADDRNVSKTTILDDNFLSLDIFDYIDPELTLSNGMITDTDINALIWINNFWEVGKEYVIQLINPTGTWQVKTGDGTYNTYSKTFFYKCENVSEHRLLLKCRTRLGTLDGLKITETTAVYPILNYSQTQRTNFTAQESGLNRVFRDVNDLGFYDGLRSVPKGDGVSYGDTGLFIDGHQSVTMHNILKVKDNTKLREFGLFGASTNDRFQVSLNSNGNLYCNVFGVLSNVGNYSTFNNMPFMLSITINDLIVTYYINGVPRKTETLSVKQKLTYAFYLCANNKYNTINTYDIEHLLFYLDYKASAQEEVTTVYNDAVSKGLLS